MKQAVQIGRAWRCVPHGFRFFWTVAIWIPAFSAAAAEVDISKLPPPVPGPIDFARDIKPIFEAVCFRCHGAEKPKSGFRLDNEAAALKGGESGVAIKPGDSANSPLIHLVAGLVEDMKMPPPGKGDRLTPAQIGALRKWIDEGAKWPPELAGAERTTQLSITPVLRYVTVNGDERKFSQDWRRKQGFSGGYDQFEMVQPVGTEAELRVDGRALFDDRDYGVSLVLTQPRLGFVRAGYDTYRKYFDDTGGFYAPYGLPPPSLDQDLYVDLGKAWLDVGLSIPDAPRLTLGYEYQFKDGEQSTLQWGQVADPNDPFAFFGKAIYPSSKAIDERAHVLKFDAEHEVAGYLLEDSFRAEFYEMTSRRLNRGDFTPDTFAEHREAYDHFQLANTFQAEKQFLDWLLLSGGYLYTRLEGEGAFDQTYGSLSSAFPSFAGDTSTAITLEQSSHTVNVNSLLGPWEGFTVSAGVQSEWLRREGLGNLLVPGFPAAVPANENSNQDRWTIEEDLSLRYNRIPYTVLYAEGRFQQSEIDYFEQNLIDDLSADNRDFVRDTDATGDLEQYRAGFTFSPIPRVSLESSYQRRDTGTDFDHTSDFDGSQPPFGIPGNGYPAFIRSRDTTSDEVEARLVLRPVSWLKTTLKYQHVSTDYHTSMDPSVLPSFPTNIIYAGGEILSGNQDADVYSVNVVLTRWRRFYLSGTVSFSDSRLVSGVNDGAILVPYQGDVWSVLSSANFAANKSTDLRTAYSFSRADYRQDNEVDGLPLGIRYGRHAVTAGITRRFTKNLSGTAQYGFFYYREPTAADANDYTAHAFMTSLNVRLP